jgi:DNA-directed RNA polymerase subunit RPC12/RpoP
MYFFIIIIIMPQKKVPLEKIELIKELRRKGYTYRQIHKQTSVSTGKIAEICESEKPVISINSLERRVSQFSKTIFELEKQLVAIRDRTIDETLSGEQDFVCPNCAREFMAFEESRKPFMKCPSCEYTLVFGEL